MLVRYIPKIAYMFIFNSYLILFQENRNDFKILTVIDRTESNATNIYFSSNPRIEVM